MILHHPRIPDTTVDVPDKDVPAWLDQGWTKRETKAVREHEEPVVTLSPPPERKRKR